MLTKQRRSARRAAGVRRSAPSASPGSMPFIPRIIFCMPPLATIFIIFCVCSNWLSSWLTSCTGTPAPAAMRRLREALRISGFARSCGVIELMMPSMRADAPLVDLVALCAARASSRGQLVEQPGEAAHLAHLADLRLEVVEVEALARLDLLRELLRPPRRRRSSALPRSATARRPCRGCATPCARDGTPRGRRSSPPTPANLIGAPVTWRTDSAAPPRASPSSLVSTTPVSGSASLNALRRVDRVLALHRIDDEQRLDRLAPRRAARRSPASSPRRSPRRPAVSTISTS